MLDIVPINPLTNLILVHRLVVSITYASRHKYSLGVRLSASSSVATAAFGPICRANSLFTGRCVAIILSEFLPLTSSFVKYNQRANSKAATLGGGS
jgi:hypothetical protein